MTIRVRAKDGTIQTFPAGTSPETVRMAMTAYNDPENWGALRAKIGSAAGKQAEAPAGERRKHAPSPFDNPILDAIGKRWGAGNTVLGLAAAGASYLAGLAKGTHPKFQVGDNAIQLLNSPWNYDHRPYTLGNVQIYPPDRPPNHLTKKSYTGVSVPEGAHEAGHSAQAQLLGPAYLPAWLLGELLPGVNPMEAGADKFAEGKSWSGF